MKKVQNFSGEVITITFHAIKLNICKNFQKQNRNCKNIRGNFIVFLPQALAGNVLQYLAIKVAEIYRINNAKHIDIRRWEETRLDNTE